MKKILLAIAAVLLIMDMQAQYKTTFEKVSDSLYYVTEPAYGGGMVTREAYPVDHAQMTADINNRIRKATGFQIGGVVCSAASTASAMLYAKSKEDVFMTASIITAVAAVCLECAAVYNMFPERVTATPDGIILKLGKKRK